MNNTHTYLSSQYFSENFSGIREKREIFLNESGPKIEQNFEQQKPKTTEEKMSDTGKQVEKKTGDIEDRNTVLGSVDGVNLPSPYPEMNTAAKNANKNISGVLAQLPHSDVSKLLQKNTTMPKNAKNILA